MPCERRHMHRPYFDSEPPSPLGPGAAGLPAPTPMPAPGTDNGAPCASLEPCTAGGGALMRTPSDVISHAARHIATPRYAAKNLIALPSKTDAHTATTAATPCTGADTDVDAMAGIGRIVCRRCAIVPVRRRRAAGHEGQRQQEKKTGCHHASGNLLQKLGVAMHAAVQPQRVP